MLCLNLEVSQTKVVHWVKKCIQSIANYNKAKQTWNTLRIADNSCAIWQDSKKRAKKGRPKNTLKWGSRQGNCVSQFLAVADVSFSVFVTYCAWEAVTLFLLWCPRFIPTRRTDQRLWTLLIILLTSDVGASGPSLFTIQLFKRQRQAGKFVVRVPMKNSEFPFGPLISSIYKCQIEILGWVHCSVVGKKKRLWSGTFNVAYFQRQ